MKRKHRLIIVRTLAFLAIGISPAFPSRIAKCEGQTNSPPNDYDFHTPALTSILNSAREASKLPDISERVRLLIDAAKILKPVQPEEAMRLLDVGLVDLKQWISEKTTNKYQRYLAANLRTELLALYAQLDPEKTSAIQKQLQSEAKTPSAEASATSLRTDDWYSQFDERVEIADEFTKVAFSLIDTDPQRALGLIVQSLKGGTVSGGLFEIVQKLIQNGNRSLLNKVEFAIGQTLTSASTLDPTSVSYASSLVLVDKDMSSTARSGLTRFIMNSLNSWATVAKEPGIDPSYLSRGFFAFSFVVRPAISQYSPEQLMVFDSILNQVKPLVPERTRSVVQALEPETLRDPADRLQDILKEPDSVRRDHRLSRFIDGLLGPDRNLDKTLDLVQNAVNELSAADAKSAYTNLLAIVRIDTFVKQKKFIEAQELVGLISPDETRTWALLALARAAAKVDPILGFELISNALRALDKASPSPHKVELALMAAAMLAKTHQQRAFDTLAIASKYANSSVKVAPPASPAFAFGLEANIGEAQTKVGVFPESLAELKIDPALTTLATADWFRAEYIVNEIREPSLRLQLKLQLAGAVLTQHPKPTRKTKRP